MNPNRIVLMHQATAASPVHTLARRLKQTFIRALLLACFLLGLPSTHAAVLVYQFRTTGKVVGGAMQYSYSSRGYIVWDLVGHQLTWITYGGPKGSGTYKLNQGTPVVASFTGPGDKRQVTFSGAGSENGRYFQDFNRGSTATLKHRTGQTMQFPRTLKGLSHTFSTGLSSRLDDNTHTMVYSQARTVAANDADKSAAEVVADLTAELEAAGYTEALPSPSEIITFSSSSMLDSGLPVRILSTNAPAGNN